MLVYDLNIEKFVDSTKEQINYKDIIILAYCSKSEDYALTLITAKYDIYLRNGSNKQDVTALNLFKTKDRKFKEHLDYFTNR